MREATKDNIGKCKFCQMQVIWKQNKPYDSENIRHRCDKFPKVTPVIVTRTIEPQDLKDLKEEIGYIKTKLAQEPKPEPTNGLEKRVLRLESIVVEMQNKIRQILPELH